MRRWPYTFLVILSAAIGITAVVLSQRLGVPLRDPEGFLTRAPDLADHPALLFVRGNQGDFTFPEGRFEAVIHAAVEYGGPLQTFEQNLLGTRRVLEFAARSGAGRVLFTSSGAVYGPQPPELERLAEEWPGSPDLADPASAYGLAKRGGEHLGHLLAVMQFLPRTYPNAKW